MLTAPTFANPLLICSNTNKKHTIKESSVPGRKRKYCDETVVKAANMRAAGKSYRTIAKELEIPLTMVWRMAEGQYGEKREDKVDKRVGNTGPDTDVAKTTRVLRT